MIKISVVIPTYNRRHLLKKCLLKLCAQTMKPSAFEIIVADDENSTKTFLLTAYVRMEHPMHHIHYTRVQPGHGPAAARNCGWRKAQGEIIAFIDDDCLAKEDWLESAYGAMNGNDAVWGKVIVPLPKEPTDYELNTAGLNKGEFVTANCLCRKALLQTINGFDERFKRAWREDSDLYFNMIKLKAKMAFVPQAVVVHPTRTASFGCSMVMQENNMYEALLYKKHPELYQRYADLPIIRYFYIIVMMLSAAILMMIGGEPNTAWVLGTIWGFLTLGFMALRLKNSSRHFEHVAEVIFTSVFIPPLAVFWRLAGNLKFWKI